MNVLRTLWFRLQPFLRRRKIEAELNEAVVGARVVAAKPRRFCPHVAKRAAASGRALGNR